MRRHFSKVVIYVINLVSLQSVEIHEGYDNFQIVFVSLGVTVTTQDRRLSVRSLLLVVESLVLPHGASVGGKADAVDDWATTVLDVLSVTPPVNLL